MKPNQLRYILRKKYILYTTGRLSKRAYLSYLNRSFKYLKGKEYIRQRNNIKSEIIYFRRQVK